MSELMNDLIEKQISEVAETLIAIGPTFERPREIAHGIAGLALICERLLQIVQAQHQQIKTQDEILRTLQADVCDLIGAANSEDERQCYNERRKREQAY